MGESYSEILEKYSIKFKEIETSTDYWLIRTNGGQYYNDFSLNNFISIGWDELSDFNDYTSRKMPENIAENIGKHYPKNQPGRIYGQIRRFIYEISVGDVIMIPSEDSKIINFGIVTSDVFLREVGKSEDSDKCAFVKSRNVQWIKEIARDKLDPYLFRMMQSHQTVNNAKEYAHYIDRTMYSFYVKEGKGYLVLPVQKKEDIPAYDLLQFMNSILNVVPFINELEGSISSDNYSHRGLDIKLNVQSPGFIEFKSDDASLVMKLGALLKGLLIKRNEKESSLFSNDELVRELFKGSDPSNFKKHAEIRKELEKNFERVEATLPNELK